MRSIEGSGERGYGGLDLWQLDLMETGRKLPCSNAKVFLHYLCSEGTRSVSIRGYSATEGTVLVVLRGPRADDGRFLSVSYDLSREEVHGDGESRAGLEDPEKRLLVERVEELNPTGREPWPLARRAFSGVLDLPYAA